MKSGLEGFRHLKVEDPDGAIDSDVEGLKLLKVVN